MISKILVASDDSVVAKKAFKYAVDLAGQLKASIVIVTVIDTRAYVAQTVPMEMSYMEIMEPIERHLRIAAEKYLERAKKIAGKKKVTCKGVIRNGHPVEEILKEAKKERVSMIVLGSHGKSTLTTAVLGSVTYGVIHKDTKYPVLVIR